jgi:hypothetical protein
MLWKITDAHKAKLYLKNNQRKKHWGHSVSSRVLPSDHKALALSSTPSITKKRKKKKEKQQKTFM